MGLLALAIKPRSRDDFFLWPGRNLREASAVNLTSDRGASGGGSSAASCAIGSSVAGCDTAAPVLEQFISTLAKVLKKSAEKISSEMAMAESADSAEGGTSTLVTGDSDGIGA